MTSRAAEARRLARELFDVGVAAADPLEATRRALPAALEGEWRRVRAVAFGKAACAMSEAFARETPESLWRRDGLAVTNHENVRDVDGFTVLGAGHPLPDADGVRAASEVAAAARDAAAGEVLVVLVSGGGSAILPSPAEGISLEEKIATTRLLLASGADIGELNAVRKHLSVLKGGGLARLAAPAAVRALLLSDVIGDDPSVIASGPTVPDPSTFAQALDVLSRRGVLERAPTSVRGRLERGARGELAETPKPGDSLFDATRATVVGGNRRSLDALRARARQCCDVHTISEALCGEARDEARRFAAAAVELVAKRADERPLALVAGGETTVTVTGSGRGGRNQEMALAFALAAAELGLDGDWVFLSGGTDGIDGPTDAAGGLVDPRTLERLRKRGVDAHALLADNDAYAALEASGDLLMTGATGTNVADLQVFVAV